MPQSDHNPITGGQLVINTLRALGADRVVGLPGQHALPLFDALRGSDLQYYGARVENNAGFIADGAARTTGSPVPLLLSAGPGALTALPALQEAAAASSPVLLIVAQVPESGIGGGVHGFLHELYDQRAHFRDTVKKTWSIRSVDQVIPMITQAWQTAIAAPAGPVYVEIPYDVQIAVEQEPIAPTRAIEVFPTAPIVPNQLLNIAADLLAAAKTPRIYAGGGVVRSGAAEALHAISERLQAPVVTTFGGRSSFEWSHPLSAQGWIEDIDTTEFLEEADVLLVVGTGLGELTTNYFTFRPKGKIIQIDADASVLGRNYPSLGLAGDAKETLTAISSRLEMRLPSADPERRQRALASIEQLVAGIHKRIDAQSLQAEQQLIADLRSAIPDQIGTYWDMTILAYWAWSAWDARGGAFENAQCGGLGFGLPAAIGASFAGINGDNPLGTPTVAISGDGGGLYSVADLASLAQENLNVTWVVFDDGGYGVLRGYMDAAFGDHVATDLAVPDYVALGAAFGIKSRRVEPAELHDAVAESISSQGPEIIVVPVAIELFEPTHLNREPIL